MSRSVELPNMYRLQFERGWIEWDHDNATQFRFSSDNQTTVKAKVKCEARWASGSRFTFALAEQLRAFARACRGDSPAALVLATKREKVWTSSQAATASAKNWRSRMVPSDNPFAIAQPDVKYAVLGAGGFVGGALVERLYRAERRSRH